jgi:formylglycine-generating enzyme required for sulfatase activity
MVSLTRNKTVIFVFILVVCANSSLSQQSITIHIPNLAGGARPLVLVRIPSGSFQMGNSGTDRDLNCWSSDCISELPSHQVVIENDFYMGETEVTQAQWQAVMETTPTTTYGSGDNHPVHYVSWQDLTKDDGFLDRLTALGEGVFRLPSEAEWEYACRGPASSPHRYDPFSFGDGFGVGLSSRDRCDEFDRNMVYCGSGKTSAEEVASRLPNGYGLYDMHGNVWEWCQDAWHESYDIDGDGECDAPLDGSAWEDTAEISRVIRGGYWNHLPRYCRSAFRYRHKADSRYFDIGFRVVLSPSPQPR